MKKIAARRFRKCRDEIRGTSLVAFGGELKNALDELQTGKKEKKNSSEHVWICHRIKRRRAGNDCFSFMCGLRDLIRTYKGCRSLISIISYLDIISFED